MLKQSISRRGASFHSDLSNANSDSDDDLIQLDSDDGIIQLIDPDTLHSIQVIDPGTLDNEENIDLPIQHTMNTISTPVVAVSETEDVNDGNDSIIPEISPIHAQSMSSHLWSLYKSKSCTDITVRCGEHTYNLHSCVLSHGSTYFQKILQKEGYHSCIRVPPGTTTTTRRSTTDLTTTTNNTTTSMMTIELDLAFPMTIESKIFDIIVESLYTGTVRGITKHNVTLLLGASHDLQIPHILDATCNYMMNRLDYHNCLEYYLAAKLCNMLTHPLQLASMGYLGRHLPTISHTQFFLELSEGTIIDILMDDGLQVPSEHVVYDAGMAWIKYEEEGRKSSLNGILETIRLPQLSVDFLIRVVGKEYLIQDDHDAVSKYSHALQYKLNATACRNDDDNDALSAVPPSPRKIGYGVSDKNFKPRHSFSYRIMGALERFHVTKSYDCCWGKGGDNSSNEGRLNWI